MIMQSFPVSGFYAGTITSLKSPEVTRLPAKMERDFESFCNTSVMVGARKGREGAPRRPRRVAAQLETPPTPWSRLVTRWDSRRLRCRVTENLKSFLSENFS